MNQAPEGRRNVATGEATAAPPPDAQPVESACLPSPPRQGRRSFPGAIDAIDCQPFTAPPIPCISRTAELLCPSGARRYGRSLPRVALCSPTASDAPPVATFRRPLRGQRSHSSTPDDANRLPSLRWASGLPDVCELCPFRDQRRSWRHYGTVRTGFGHAKRSSRDASARRFIHVQSDGWDAPARSLRRSRCGPGRSETITAERSTNGWQPHYAITSRSTFPATSVRRKSRPAWR